MPLADPDDAGKLSAAALVDDDESADVRPVVAAKPDVYNVEKSKSEPCSFQSTKLMV